MGDLAPLKVECLYQIASDWLQSLNSRSSWSVASVYSERARQTVGLQNTLLVEGWAQAYYEGKGWTIAKYSLTARRPT